MCGILPIPSSGVVAWTYNTSLRVMILLLRSPKTSARVIVDEIAHLCNNCGLVMLELLSRNDIDQIHAASLEILRVSGVVFSHDGALDIFQQMGALVDMKKKIVKIPEAMVKEALNKAPREIVLLARNKQCTLTLGGGQVHFTNGFGAIHVLDADTRKRRLASLKDLEDFTLICDALPNVHYLMSQCIPQEISPSIVDRHIASAMFKNTSKHFCVTALDLQGLRDILKMAAVVAGGEEAFRRKRSIINGGIAPVSPLQYPNDTVSQIMEFCRLGIPLELCSGVISGATGPVTIAGTISLANAEDLAALVLAQAINPGTPIVFGTMATIMDMKYGSYAYGSPELGLINGAFAQIAHHYGLPCFGTSGTIDSKIPDEQAAYEAAISNTIAVLSGTDVIHDGVYGILESALTASYEQLIISHEIASMTMRIIRGIDVNEETLATKLITSMGPGASYLSGDGLKHTRKHLFEQHWQPEITDRQGRSQWERSGSRDVVKRGHDRVQQILAEHKPHPLDKEVEAKIEQIVRDAAVRA